MIKKSHISVYSAYEYVSMETKGVILGHNFVYLAMYYNMEVGTNNLYI